MEMEDVVHEPGTKTERTLVHVSTDNETIDIHLNRRCCDPRDTEFFKIEKQLLPFKAWFFFFGGAIGAVFPYFSIFFKQLGFSPNQIGIISGVRPLVGFCSGPVWGSLADHFRIRKIMLLISTIGWLAFITPIGFVPPAKISYAECEYVSDFVNASVSGQYSPAGSEFSKEHKLRPGITPEESLLESRGWMFDSVDLQRAFITIIILVILGEIAQSPAGALADSGCIDQLGDNDMHKYGHQRAFGSLGLGLCTMVVGSILSTTRRDVSVCGVDSVVSNYHVAFYFFAGCMVCCFLTAWTFRFQKQADDHADAKPKPNPLKVFRMFLTLHYGSWLFCMFFTGVCNGVIWGFLFWHLENIGATQLMMGVANSVSLFSEFLMFFFVFRILRRTGCLLFMVIGLLGYSVRFIVFAVIEEPWWILPFEILQGFTFAGIWSVYTKYLCESVPREYLGTLQGFLHGVYWGLGAGTGFLISGISVENLGARTTFWIFSVASFVNAVIFVTIQKCTKKPKVFGTYEELNQQEPDFCD